MKELGIKRELLKLKDFALLLHFYKNKICPYNILNSKAAKHYAGLSLIENDLQTLLGFIELMEIHENDIKYGKEAHSSFFSFVILYGKLFARAKGRKMKLNEKKHLKDANQFLKKIHKEIIETRNNYVAHGGTTTKEQVNIFLLWDPDPTLIKAIGITPGILKSIAFDQKNIKIAKNLINFLLQKLNKEIDLVSIHLMKEVKKEGFEKAAKKSGHSTGEGLISTYVHHSGKIASVVEVLCETDFVARNEIFKELTHNLALQVASMNPKDAKELETQDFVKDSSKKVSELVREVIAKTGENVRIGRIYRIELGGK